MLKTIVDMLGPKGELAKKWKSYEPRVGQIKMSCEVARAFEEDDLALIEAGTGTGKTLAYLLPAIISGKKTLISTGLKNLQDQIFYKDIPFIHKFFGDNFKCVLLKGRSNYLCPYYLNQCIDNYKNYSPNQQNNLDKALKWSQKTKTGDRSEVKEFEEGLGIWSEISAPAERCLGQKCPLFSDCFLWKARKEAIEADIVLINHHLFMADLALRSEGFGEVIPEWEAVIFDEAHLLEDAATSYFGRAVSYGALLALKKDLDWLTANKEIELTASLKKTIAIFALQIEVFYKNFYKDVSEIEPWREDSSESHNFKDFLNNLYNDIESLNLNFKVLTQKYDLLSSISKRLDKISQDLLFFIEASDFSYIYQLERSPRNLILSAYPIKISKKISSLLINSGKTQIYTSATLTVKENFKYFKNKMGIWPELEGIIIDSPFDYQNRTLLYLPKHLPNPQEENFIEQVKVELEKLILISQGRALVLFTSYKNMAISAEYLKNRLDYTLLVQGEMSRGQLLEKFKEEKHSVLLATYSFWQGVDIPGESLSSLIIEKIPFPRPDRPLVRARCELIEENGGNPFMEYYIPEAIFTLKQGVGRLMRTDSDQGLLAILDKRLSEKHYGKLILGSLPPSKKTEKLKDVELFLKNI